MAITLAGRTFANRAAARVAAKRSRAVARALYQHRIGVSQAKHPNATRTQLRGHAPAVDVYPHKYFTTYETNATVSGARALAEIVRAAVSASPISDGWLSALGQYKPGIIGTDERTISDRASRMSKSKMAKVRDWKSLSFVTSYMNLDWLDAINTKADILTQPLIVPMAILTSFGDVFQGVQRLAVSVRN